MWQSKSIRFVTLDLLAVKMVKFGMKQKLYLEHISIENINICNNSIFFLTSALIKSIIIQSLAETGGWPSSLQIGSRGA